MEQTTQGDGTFVDTLVGVASLGAGCGQPNTPNVYARTSAAFKWIKDTVCNELDSIGDICPTTPTTSPTPGKTKSPKKTK